MTVGFAAQAIASRYLPNENPINLLSTQEVKKIVSVSLLYCAGWMSDNQMKKAASSQAQLRQGLEHFKSRHGHIPIYRLLLDYNKPIPSKRGNKADPWGTLFLLAVTDYLREKTGKPHYGEVVKLLQKTRMQYERYSPRRSKNFLKTTAQSALVRVKKF